MSSGFITKKVAFISLVIYLVVLAICGFSAVTVGGISFFQNIMYSNGIIPSSLSLTPTILSVVIFIFLALVGVCFYEMSIILFTQADIQKELLKELKALRNDARLRYSDNNEDTLFDMKSS